MKLLHQIGHNHKWNLDAYFNNNIGNGFIFSAYSFDDGKVGGRLSTYDGDEYLPLSLMDLQYYGNKLSKDFGHFSSYGFHPSSYSGSDSTTIYGPENIMQGVQYQIELGLSKIIIPMYFYEYDEIDKMLEIIKGVNKLIAKDKIDGIKYFMTIPFSNRMIKDNSLVQQILTPLTDRDIVFDGFYVVCDSEPGFRKKISSDPSYYSHLGNVFRTLKAQKFETIYGYANFDSLVFAAAIDIDYITFGSFENLRMFNMKRYTQQTGGGPSDGWYYSEKLLNFIKADNFKYISSRGYQDLIKNERNIFSDIISKPDYLWNSQKPDVHKNYMLAISNQFSELHGQGEIKSRIQYMLEKIKNAREIYAELNEHGIVLHDSEGDEHLSAWLSFLQPLAK